MKDKSGPPNVTYGIGYAVKREALDDGQVAKRITKSSWWGATRTPRHSAIKTDKD